jgi:hypothetical protein
MLQFWFKQNKFWLENNFNAGSSMALLSMEFWLVFFVLFCRSYVELLIYKNKFYMIYHHNRVAIFAIDMRRLFRRPLQPSPLCEGCG